MRRPVRIVVLCLFFVMLLLLLLLGRYQYFRYKGGKIFSIFQIKSFVIDDSCKEIDANFFFVFDEKLKKQGEQISTINFKGLVVGSKKDSKGNGVLVLKTPGLLFPKYFNLDAGDANWNVFTSTEVNQTAEVAFSQMTKNCPVVAGVIIYNPKTVDCRLGQEEQKPCEYLQKMTGVRSDNRLINELFFGKKNFWRGTISKVSFFTKQVFYIGPVITLDF